MSGYPVIDSRLKMNSLKAFRERLASDIFTMEDLLSLVNEAEEALAMVSDLKCENTKLEQIGSVLSHLAWEGFADTIDVERLRNITDIFRYDNLSLSSYTDITRMQNLLARFVHKIDENGSITKEDELILDTRRYLRDARLIKQKE